jgi:parallel beta-helix repeat protein
MRRVTPLAITCALIVCFSAFSAASTVQVGGCLPSVVNFTSIQGAINAVPAGSTIKICPGNYQEQLLIRKKLTVTGIADAGADAVVIYPPAGGLVQNTTDARGAVAAQILVQSPTASPISVSISNITVDGTGNNYNNDDLRGILYQDASGTVNHVAVRNELPGDILSGLQSGQGIMVETTNFGAAVLNVQNSSVHNYNKNGILARYAGARLNATGNYVQGNGPTAVIAQNGIELAFNGAAGSIKNNTVIDNYYSGDQTQAVSSDILLYDAANLAIVSANTVGNSNVPIALVTNFPGTYGDNTTVSLNKIMGSSIYDGIDVCTNSNTITGNTIFNSTESGIHLDATCGGTGNGNTVTGNTILESGCAGILEDAGTSGTTDIPNTFYTVPTLIASSCPAPAARTRARTHNSARP